MWTLFTKSERRVHDEEESNPPINFSWIIKNQLAAMGWPSTGANLRYLIKNGIRNLITLSPERRPPVQNFPQIHWMEIPVREFEAPTIYQIREFLSICEKYLRRKQAIGIHCRQGKGRTGVMVACFLVYFQGLPPDRAIINVRMQRPGSIETPEQERVIHRFHDYLKSK